MICDDLVDLGEDALGEILSNGSPESEGDKIDNFCI